jgi:hypothetical protein
MYKNKISILAFVVLLAISLMACSIGGTKATEVPASTVDVPNQATEAPTQQAAPTDPSTVAPPIPKPASQDTGEGLEVINPIFYQDAYDAYHVVGLLKNTTDRAISDVELSLEARNADGVSLLKDDNDAVAETTSFSPMLLYIFPGESAPFDYYFYAENESLASIQVTATSSYPTDTTPGDVQVANTALLNAGSGEYYITGEVINQSSSPAYIKDLSGALLDESGNVVAAEWSHGFSYYLAPAGDSAGLDRTPFTIDLSGPEDSDYKDFKVFPGAVVTDETYNYDLSVSLTNSYFDEYGSFHVVGTLENRGLQPTYAELVTGLYDANGIVLDADSFNENYSIEPGMTVPFDSTYFTIVGSNEDYANRVDHYTVQIDPYWTMEPYYDLVTLKTIQITDTIDGSFWSFTGEITNDSGKDCGSAILVVAAYAGETLVAVNTTSIFPQDDSIAPGDAEPFDLTLYLEPGVDASTLTYKVFLQGQLK